MKTVRVTGKTVEEAVAEGLSQLGISREAAIVHVVEEPSGGLFGLLRRKQAVVDVSCMDGERADRAFLDELAQEGREAAAKAIASLVSEGELCEEYIIPGAFDDRVAPAVAAAVAQAARESGVARL